MFAPHGLMSALLIVCLTQTYSLREAFLTGNFMRYSKLKLYYKIIGQIGENFEQNTKYYVYGDTIKLILYSKEDKVKALPH